MMKIKKGFELRDICGEQVVMATGIENVDFNKMVSLNESAAFLWRKVDGQSFDADTLADLLVSEYEGVTQETATADAQQIIREWMECGIIEDAQ